MNMNTKERLINIRTELGGLNQRELSAYIGAPIRTVASWSSDERDCPEYVLELIERIAEADARSIEEGCPASIMERWAVIDAAGMDEWLTVCGSKADALKEAARQWGTLTDSEKKDRLTFMVAKIHCQIFEGRPHDGRFTWAELPDGSIDGDVYEIAKDFKAGE